MTPQTNTQEKYEPTKFYIDVETTPYCLDNQREHTINHTELIIGSEQGTMFPTRVSTTVCNALIATGATRCCVSEEYYKKLQLSTIHLLQTLVSDQPLAVTWLQLD